MGIRILFWSETLAVVFFQSALAETTEFYSGSKTMDLQFIVVLLVLKNFGGAQILLLQQIAAHARGANQNLHRPPQSKNQPHLDHRQNFVY